MPSRLRAKVADAASTSARDCPTTADAPIGPGKATTRMRSPEPPVVSTVVGAAYERPGFSTGVVPGSLSGVPTVIITPLASSLPTYRSASERCPRALGASGGSLGVSGASAAADIAGRRNESKRESTCCSRVAD
ncbi:unannotated protein [freshwater metagenome]|uniref:Unannotated protein n=1 Tax=freshwater metagenome TaxID=449393 RepID=A0A6J7KR71_9ZZZZ